MTSRRATIKAALAALCAASLLLTTDADARNIFIVPDASAAARAWTRARDLLWVAEQAAVLLLFATLLFSRLGARLAAKLDTVTSGRRLAAAALLAGLYAVFATAVTLPMSAIGQILAAPLGLAAPRWAEWSVARAREAATLAVGASLLAWVAYWLFAKSPVFWPVWMGALAIGATTLSLAAQPLAHGLRPLDNPELAATVSRLAARAGAPAPRAALRIVTRDGRCGGATVLGLGPTKVLALDAGLLRHHPRREVEQTIAHELKHYLHGDDRKALYAATLIIASGVTLLFFGSAFATRVSGGRWGFDRVDDSASLPLLILIAVIFNLAATAGFHAYGRHIEQEADRFSLGLTHDNFAQAALLQRLLSCSRLKNPDVGWVQKTFRQNHPSIRERMAAAQAFEP